MVRSNLLDPPFLDLLLLLLLLVRRQPLLALSFLTHRPGPTPVAMAAARFALVLLLL